MKRRRDPVGVVLLAYGITYGILAAIIYYGLATHQRPEDHAKFPPSWAFIWAGLYATAIFAAIAAVWGVGAMLWATICVVRDFMRGKRF